MFSTITGFLFECDLLCVPPNLLSANKHTSLNISILVSIWMTTPWQHSFIIRKQDSSFRVWLPHNVWVPTEHWFPWQHVEGVPPFYRIREVCTRVSRARLPAYIDLAEFLLFFYLHTEKTFSQYEEHSLSLEQQSWTKLHFNFYCDANWSYKDTDIFSFTGVRVRRMNVLRNRRTPKHQLLCFTSLTSRPRCDVWICDVWWWISVVYGLIYWMT